jgi:hypothetical protein
MFLNAGHPSSAAFPAGTMIVLRLRVTDASETCNQLLGLKELPCFVIKSEAVLPESSSIP